MLTFDEMQGRGHEQITLLSHVPSGLRAVLAIHSTVLGPAIAGCRLVSLDEDLVLKGALALSESMTLKSALTGLNYGGASCVLLSPDTLLNEEGGDAQGHAREALFRALGRQISYLGGRVILTEDVRVSGQDIAYAAQETSSTMGMNTDTAAATAYGVYRGIKAAARYALGSESMRSVRVAILGVGTVGRLLAELLHREGAKLSIADVQPERAEELASDLDHTQVLSADNLLERAVRHFFAVRRGLQYSEPGRAEVAVPPDRRGRASPAVPRQRGTGPRSRDQLHSRLCHQRRGPDRLGPQPDPGAGRRADLQHHLAHHLAGRAAPQTAASGGPQTGRAPHRVDRLAGPSVSRSEAPTSSEPPTHQAPFVIGVSGGSGSGKTTVTRRVIEAVGSAGAAVIPQDNYYLDQAGIPPEIRRGTNYDHPAAFDWPLLREHLDALLSGTAIQMPTYDFTRDTRASATLPLSPAPVVVLEGFFALYDAELRSKMHLKVFVDADADVRFIRRLERDTRERGRSLESVIQQYLDYVRPMHLSFVEPTKRYADVIIQHGGMNEPALDMLAARIRATLR